MFNGFQRQLNKRVENKEIKEYLTLYLMSALNIGIRSWKVKMVQIADRHRVASVH